MKKIITFLLAISLSFSISDLLAKIDPDIPVGTASDYILPYHEEEGLPCLLLTQEYIEDQETPSLMMDPVSAEEVGKALKEKILGKEALSGANKPVDNKWNAAVAHKEHQANEEIVRMGKAQERVEEATAARTGFIELVKNDAKNRSAFISELQQIWTSDIISTSSEVVIKLVADTRYEALKADLSAIEAKTEAHKMDLDKELKAYKETAGAWNKTAIACNQAFSSVNTINIASNSNKEIEELTTLLKTAEVRASTWTAHIPWVKAREKELAIKDPDHLSEEEAVDIETAWEETIEATQAALDKLYEVNLPSLVTLEEPEINALLTEAKKQQANWVARIKELKTLETQGVETTGANGKQNREDLLLQEIKRNKAKADQLARKAVYSEKNQRAYESWELPGEIPNFSFHVFEEVDEERTSEAVEPPEILNEELEEKGRRLLRSERAVQEARETARTSITAAITIASSSSYPAAITEVTARDLFNHEEQLEASIMAESLNPTPENKLRWEARKIADQLIVEAAKIAKRERALKLAKAEENEEASENDETATLTSSISKSLSNLGSSFGIWRPKAISVLGSVTDEVSKTSASQGSQSSKPAKKTGESDLERADREVEEAETKWKEMILHPEYGAETRRVKNLSLQSTETAKSFVTPVLESSGMPYTF
ncbi:MAG TPA: hypothetical protein VJK54_03235, partial [Chthoniobacterales bacterium]|nr:hypothetical protein [Chthoniobacterales bacterium]